MIDDLLYCHPAVYQYNFCTWEWQSVLKLTHRFMLSTLTMCHTNHITSIADNMIKSCWVWPAVASVSCWPLSGLWRPRQTTCAKYSVNGQCWWVAVTRKHSYCTNDLTTDMETVWWTEYLCKHSWSVTILPRRFARCDKYSLSSYSMLLYLPSTLHCVSK